MQNISMYAWEDRAGKQSDRKCMKHGISGNVKGGERGKRNMNQ